MTRRQERYHHAHTCQFSAEFQIPDRLKLEKMKVPIISEILHFLMVCVTESFLLTNALTNYQSSEAVYCSVLERLPFKETAISQKILSMITCLQLECQGKSVD